MLADKDIEFSMYAERWRIKTKGSNLALFKQIADPFGDPHWKMIKHYELGKAPLNHLVLESMIQLFFKSDGDFVDFDKKESKAATESKSVRVEDAFSIGAHERSEFELKSLREG